MKKNPLLRKWFKLRKFSLRTINVTKYEEGIIEFYFFGLMAKIIF